MQVSVRSQWSQRAPKLYRSGGLVRVVAVLRRPIAAENYGRSARLSHVLAYGTASACLVVAIFSSNNICIRDSMSCVQVGILA